MIQCQNCGQTNTAESKFCRFCGTRFLLSQNPVPKSYEYQPPEPYSWRIDDLQTKTDSRKTTGFDETPTQNHLQFSGQIPFASAPLVNRSVNLIDPNYRCPHCGSQFLPRTERRISTAGWVVFAVLLIMFFPLFWIGLLIKEDVNICPSCSTKLGNTG